MCNTNEVLPIVKKLLRDHVLPIETTAHVLRVSRQRVVEMIDRGTVQSVEIGKKRFVLTESVFAAVQRRAMRSAIQNRKLAKSQAGKNAI